MREILEDVSRWQAAGKQVAVATVVKTSGSALRPLGSRMAMTPQGEICGSVTGGCVEGAVFEEARQVLRTGRPRLLAYGIPDSAAWEVGLMCGGSIEVFVESLDDPSWASIYPAIEAALAGRRICALATVVAAPTESATPVAALRPPGATTPVTPPAESATPVAALRPPGATTPVTPPSGDGDSATPKTPPSGDGAAKPAGDSAIGRKLLLTGDGQLSGDLGDPELNRRAAEELRSQMACQAPGRFAYRTPAGEVHVFIDVFPPPPRLVVVGAAHLAIPLVSLAKTCGYYTIVIDARAAFATHARFPHADELIVAWPADALAKLRPDEATYVACLSHDEKLDNPALQVALAHPTRYVGALGSRKGHAKRLEALREAGVPEADLARIHAPIGLNLGARETEEIALAIMAEVVAARRRGLVAAQRWR